MVVPEFLIMKEHLALDREGTIPTGRKILNGPERGQHRDHQKT
jgi:hypothetical protein